jgi:hypothetical protein
VAGAVDRVGRRGGPVRMLLRCLYGRLVSVCRILPLPMGLPLSSALSLFLPPDTAVAAKPGAGLRPIRNCPVLFQPGPAGAASAAFAIDRDDDDAMLMRRFRRIWWRVLIALVGAGALSGCYYDAYTGYWRPYPWYYPYAFSYPYYGYPPPPSANPPIGYPPPQAGYPPPAAATPPNEPVQRSPLPPPS